MDGDKRGGLGARAYEGKTPVKVKKIGHFVYEVSDIERAVKFWTDVMGFEVTESNELGIVFLHYGADHHGIGLIASDAKRRGELPASQLQHLALEVENVEALLAARDYLKRNNVPIVFEGRKGAGSNYGLNFLDPDGNQFELYCDIDQIGPSGRIRPRSQWIRAKTLDEAIAKPLPKEW
ncbi:MAG TPA: VOC family protein [Stellaceae bacterium]|jgi:catechol 2,3-dioxygenase-like lactoylglutathione lyase family enzyme|nr:VOC family protein [Stellaceae bacterium]